MTDHEKKRLDNDIVLMERHWRDTFRSVKNVSPGEDIKQYQINKLKRRVELYARLIIEFEAQLE